MGTTPDLSAVMGRVLDDVQAVAYGTADEGERTERLTQQCAAWLAARVWLVPAGGTSVEVPGVRAHDVDEVAQGRMPGPLLESGAAVVALGAARPGALVAERAAGCFTADEVEILEAVGCGVGLLQWAGGLARMAAGLRASAP